MIWSNASRKVWRSTQRAYAAIVPREVAELEVASVTLPHLLAALVAGRDPT
jgi:hypothetical protein